MHVVSARHKFRRCAKSLFFRLTDGVVALRQTHRGLRFAATMRGCSLGFRRHQRKRGEPSLGVFRANDGLRPDLPQQQATGFGFGIGFRPADACLPAKLIDAHRAAVGLLFLSRDETIVHWRVLSGNAHVRA